MAEALDAGRMLADADRQHPGRDRCHFGRIAIAVSHDLHETRGHGAGPVPPLVAAGVICSLAELSNLLRRSTAPGNRQPGMMTVMAGETRSRPAVPKSGRSTRIS